MPNPQIDLTTVQEVWSWISSGVAQQQAPVPQQDMDNIGIVITAFSQDVIRWTGRGPQNQIVAAKSPFVSPQDYVEDYDGTGSNAQLLRNWPILSISLLTISGNAIPKSTVFGQAGWVIDGDGRFVRLRGGGGGSSAAAQSFSLLGAAVFVRDVQNVHVEYNAGFASIPSDLRLAATRTCALRYMGKRHIDRKSDSLGAPGGGTTTYADYDIYKSDLQVVMNYARGGVC